MQLRRQFSSFDHTCNYSQTTSPFKRFIEIMTHYDTPKVVRFESKWIASLSLLVKLSLAFGCLYLMFQRNSYQIFDRSPISAVTISVEPSTYCSRNSSIMHYFRSYNCTQSVYDVNDFILPATENSAVSITTRMTEIEHILKLCDKPTETNRRKKYSFFNATSLHSCHEQQKCILPPYYREESKNITINRTRQLCWFKSSEIFVKENYQALDYILFVKNFVEFPQLKLVRHNLASDLFNKSYIDICEYDRHKDPLCPRFRILKIIEMVEKDTSQYELMFYHGSLIEIKITWNCNLDLRLKFCKPFYDFKRLDMTPYRNDSFDIGSDFMTSKHFFGPSDRQLHRLHTNIYNLHIIVSVTGEVGELDLFQATTSIGSFLGIFGAGTIVCDLIAAFFTNLKTVKYDS